MGVAEINDPPSLEISVPSVRHDGNGVKRTFREPGRSKAAPDTNPLVRDHIGLSNGRRCCGGAYAGSTPSKRLLTDSPM